MQTLVDLLSRSFDTLPLVHANNDIRMDQRFLADRKSKSRRENDVSFAVPNLRNIRLDRHGGECDEDEWERLSAFMEYAGLFGILRDLGVKIEMLGYGAD